MSDRIAAAVAILVFLIWAGVYYQKVVVPNDEARQAILLCMLEKGDGDARGPNSRQHHTECVAELRP
jgi:hypothetical protein